MANSSLRRIQFAFGRSRATVLMNPMTVSKFTQFLDVANVFELDRFRSATRRSRSILLGNSD